MDKEAQEKMAIRLHSTERSLLRVVTENSPCNYMWDDLAEAWREHYRHSANYFLDDIIQLGYRKLPEGKPPDCENCFYKQRYQPPQLYDDDFGRITGTKRPKG